MGPDEQLARRERRDGAGKRPERVQHGLPAAGEQTPHHALEQGRVGDGDRRWTKPERHHRRADTRWWAEGSGWQGDDARRVGGQTGQDGHRAVGPRARGRDDPVGDLTLQHQRGVAKAPVRTLGAQYLKEDR